MSDEQYMTGEELFGKCRMSGIICCSWSESVLHDKWNQLAAELRIPKPPPPKTPGQLLCEYHEGDTWEDIGAASRQSWEREAARLRDALNAAFDATKGAG